MNTKRKNCKQNRIEIMRKRKAKKIVKIKKEYRKAKTREDIKKKRKLGKVKSKQK